VADQPPEQSRTHEAPVREPESPEVGAVFARLADSPEIKDIFRHAAALQAERRRGGVADRDGVTRSVLLLALLERSPDVVAALGGALDQAAWRRELRVTEDMRRRARSSPASDVQLEPELAEALSRYLSADGGELGPPELAAAVLRSALPPTGGLFGKRLESVGFDVQGHVDALDKAARAIPGGIDPQQFSASVRRVRDGLGPTSPVTAAQVAQALQTAHPGYAGGAFGGVTLRADAGRRRETDAWLADVAACYDLSRVATTRHQVVDGELTLLALAELDRDLADDLNRAGALEVLRTEVALRPRRPSSDRTEWSPDTPAVEDLLGRRPLAEALATRVRRLAHEESRSTGSFLVHVDGPWGAGKSSLFCFLDSALKHGDPAFLVVPVNAWREQRVGVQWWTLLSALQRQILREAHGLQRLRFRLAVLADRVRAAWVPFAVALLLLLSVSIAVLVGIDLRTGSQLAGWVLPILSLLSVVSAGVLAAARYLVPGSKRTAEALIENSDNPMRRVGELFARTLNRAPRPVVFLVDDLDRCDADYVVEFLEVVQTLVRDAPMFLQDHRRGRRRRGLAPGPYAFVAADGSWIRSSYERHFEPFGRTALPGRPLGYLFLEKIFQLHVVLPAVTPAARDAYLRSLLMPMAPKRSHDDEDAARIEEAERALRDAQTEAEVVSAGRAASEIKDPEERMRVLGDAAVRFSERAIEDRPDHDLARFVPLLDPNPRSMKLFVNTYGVLRSLRTLEEVFVPSEALALWTVVEIRWPALADHLRRSPESVLTWRTPTTYPAELSDLLRDEDVVQVLEDAGWGQLSPERIRECAGAP
jgi:hypothetical protein